MMHFKNPASFSGVDCGGSIRRGDCRPRRITAYWREIWLKRVAAADGGPGMRTGCRSMTDRTIVIPSRAGLTGYARPAWPGTGHIRHEKQRIARPVKHWYRGCQLALQAGGGPGLLNHLKQRGRIRCCTPWAVSIGG